MIGIVVVSHSAALAEAAVDLARQMVGDDGPAVEVAAGADGGLGTDAMAVAEALRRASSPDGVLVLVDLGSAVLSAEMALEFAPEVADGVRISPAPLVEGLVVAVVRAAGGASIDVVAREAEAALTPKAAALGPSGSGSGSGSADASADDASADDASGAVPPDGAADAVPPGAVSVRLLNPGGLHARPAATIAATVGPMSAEVVVAHGDRRADAASALELMTLQAGQGDEIAVSASGPDADAARDAVVAMAREGFGEL